MENWKPYDLRVYYKNNNVITCKFVIVFLALVILPQLYVETDKPPEKNLASVQNAINLY